jgi:ATP-dependent 26S proteasome regulatory subunit
VSNLLNICDGFLGDLLKLLVICTINCSVDAIDPAIMRPGRLLAHREFQRLSPVEAKSLAVAKKLTLADQESYSLA